jgi:tetratricopeptide (TPR) repeat protein
LCPGCAAAYLARAELHWLMGLSEAATRDAQVALFINPYGAARAYYVLGQIALAAGDVEKAKALYWRAIPPRFSSQNWEVVLYNRRAMFLPLPQRTSIGIGMAEAEPWLALADIHLAENRPEEASTIYRLLLDRDPYLPEVQRRLDELRP